MTPEEAREEQERDEARAEVERLTAKNENLRRTDNYREFKEFLGVQKGAESNAETPDPADVKPGEAWRLAAKEKERIMTNIDRAAEVLADWADSLGGLAAIERDFDGDMAGASEALADATPPLLMPDPQIIRTVEELEALDPETLLYCGWRECHYILAKDLHPDHLPAVVLLPAAQVRAALNALEEA